MLKAIKRLYSAVIEDIQIQRSQSKMHGLGRILLWIMIIGILASATIQIIITLPYIGLMALVIYLVNLIVKWIIRIFRHPS